MSKEKLKIILAAGGTGGHVFPAIAIADEIKKIHPQTAFLFVGTKGKIEARVVPEHGYTFSTIWISGFHRSLRMENFLFPIKVMVSCIQSYILLRKFQPDAAIGTGGYVCGPVLFCASILGIPAVVHESNSYPGITTRILSSRAVKVFTAFIETARWLKRKDNVELIGTPTREALGTKTREEGIRFFGLNPEKTTVLFFGGSLGAASINTAVQKNVDEFISKGIQYIWQTGKTDTGNSESARVKSYGWTGMFIEKMEYAYAAADIVVCRAGATTIAEITRLGKACILVPYPHAAADHQTFNARSMADAGAAILLPDENVIECLRTEVLSLAADTSRRNRMSTACRALGKSNAGKDIAQRIIDLAAE